MSDADEEMLNAQYGPLEDVSFHESQYNTTSAGFLHIEKFFRTYNMGLLDLVF